MTIPEKDARNVLIVDDEPDVCFLFENILRKRNLSSGYAANIADAISHVSQQKPSIIFLDNSLPDGQGMDLIPYLKEQFPEVKVIMVTANDSPNDRSRAFQKGADDFLGKPLSLDRINRTIDKVMSTNLSSISPSL